MHWRPTHLIFALTGVLLVVAGLYLAFVPLQASPAQRPLPQVDSGEPLRLVADYAYIAAIAGGLALIIAAFVWANADRRRRST